MFLLRGTAGNMVFNGLKYDDNTTNKPTFKNFFDGTALGVQGEVFVYDDPYQVYEAQGDSAHSTYPSNGWTIYGSR